MLALVGGSVRETKRTLRAALLAARAALTPAQRSAAAAAIAARVLDLPEVASARTVAAYVGVGTELPTLPLLAALRDRGVEVLLPLLGSDGSLSWGRWSGTLAEGPRGLLEPPAADTSLAGADVVIAPGVAYDALGRRLGRGGGSYDRALPAVRVPVVALALDSEIVESVPVEPHDRRVDVMVTPTRVLRP